MKICSFAESIIVNYDCFLGVSKVIQMWFLHRVKSLFPPEPGQKKINSDRLILYLSDFYSGFHHLEKVNVCISGPFSIEILILILLQLNHKMYDIKFYFTKEEYDNIKGDNFLNFLKSSTANQRVGYTISKISINEQCDILHFRDNHDTRTILTELQINVVAPIYIIWENNYTSSHGIINNNLINWEFSGLWYEGTTRMAFALTTPEDFNEINSPCLLSLDSVARDAPIGIHMGQIQPTKTVINRNSVIEGPKDVTIFITFPDSFFIETAYGLESVFRSLGYTRFVLGPLQLERYREESNQPDRQVLQLVLGGHRPGILTRFYVIFHTENLFEPFIHLDRYKTIVQQAAAVLVYSHSHLKFFHSIGRFAGIFLVPMYTRSVYFPHLAIDNVQRAHHRPKNDVMLVMSNSPRRDKFVDEFLFNSTKDDISVITKLKVDDINFYDIYTREFLGKNLFSYFTRSISLRLIYFSGKFEDCGEHTPV